MSVESNFPASYVTDAAGADDRALNKSGSDRAERILFWCFIAGLAWCPFWLGSNRPIAWGINAVLFPGLALAYEIALLVRGKRHPVGVRTIALPAALFAIVVVWVILQNATWMPAALHHPVWRLAEETLNEPMAGSISVSRNLTALALIRLLTAATVFWLSLQLCRDPKRALLLIQCIGAIGVGYAAYGLAAFVFVPGTVLWLDNPEMATRVTSTFVNRNSFATYAGMTLIALSGLLFRLYREEALTVGESLRQRIAIFIEVSSSRASLLIGAGAVVFAALLGTISRGGILASFLGFLVLLILVFMRDRKSSKALSLSGIFIVSLCLLAFFVFGDALTARLYSQGLYDSGRVAAYRITLLSVLDAPVLGFGYGTFLDLFPLLRDRSLSILGLWDKAHSTYLEVFQGLGIVFGSMLILSVGLLVYKCARGALARRQNATVSYVATAVSFLVGAHALIDFSLQIQAVTLTFMAVLGAGVAQSESSRVNTSD